MKSKTIKILFLIVSLGISFYLALQVTNKMFGKNDSNKFLTKKSTLKEGDIIFQTSMSAQCEAVRIATNSKFSHCGIIFKLNGEDYVYEAIGPVKYTKLEEWIQHGKNNDYLVKRLKNANSLLTNDAILKMRVEAEKYYHKDYDAFFEWSDKRIYCSELVWKIYENGAKIKLCPLKSLKSFHLSDPIVKEILFERYGNQVPLEEKVVAPSQLVASESLETVIDTY